jgi:hypothetical protein
MRHAGTRARGAFGGERDSATCIAASERRSRTGRGRAAVLGQARLNHRRKCSAAVPTGTAHAPARRAAQGMRTAAGDLCPLLSRRRPLPRVYGSSGGLPLPSTSNARDRMRCSPRRASPSRASRTPTRPVARLPLAGAPEASRGATARRRPGPPPGDRRPPGGAHDGVPVPRRVTLAGADLSLVRPDGGERPDRLTTAPLLADRHVVAGHEATLEAAVAHLDAREPLDVRDAVPARRDEPHGEAVLAGQRRPVHAPAQQVVAVERLLERHAARELLGDREIEAAGGIGGTVPVRPGDSTPRSSRTVTWPRSAPQRPTRCLLSGPPLAAGRARAASRPAGAVPMPPLRTAGPVLPEHSSVKSIRRDGASLRSASVSDCRRATRPTRRAASPRTRGARRSGCTTKKSLGAVRQ